MKIRTSSCPIFSILVCISPQAAEARIYGRCTFSRAKRRTTSFILYSFGLGNWCFAMQHIRAPEREMGKTFSFPFCALSCCFFHHHHLGRKSQERQYLGEEEIIFEFFSGSYFDLIQRKVLASKKRRLLGWGVGTGERSLGWTIARLHLESALAGLRFYKTKGQPCGQKWWTPQLSSQAHKEPGGQGGRFSKEAT